MGNPSLLQEKQVTRIHPKALCEQCPLYGQGHALSHGPEDADVIVISRSPAYGDTKLGKPFSGPSGKLLDHLLRINGGDRKRTFVTNVVLCRSDKPSSDAIAACKPRLEYELEQVKARRVIAAGAEAVEALAPGNTVKGARGQRLTTTDGRTLVATFNPAAALHDDVVYPDLIKDFKRALVDPKEFNPPNVTIVTEPFHVRGYCERIADKARDGYVAADIESTGLSALSNIVSIGFSPTNTEAIVFGKEVLSNPDSFAHIKWLLERRDLSFIWHNGKFDIKLLRRGGINARVDEDTMLISYLLDERPGVHSLDYMVADVLDWPLYETEAVKKGKKNGFEDFEVWDELYCYNGFDCVGSRRIFEKLAGQLPVQGLERIYRDLLIPASNVFADVESHGVLYDVKKAEELRGREILPRLAELKFKAEAITGKAINLNSWQQIGAYVYGDQGISDPKVNRKVDFSTDDATRKFLISHEGRINQNLREFLECLSEFKKLDKLRSTYVDGLIKRVDPDGRLRCDFLLHGTETGRTSSRKPNLQNQPRGETIRQLYVAPPDHVIMQADYSQCELRTMAMESGDEAMKTIYREGRDFHSETAAFHFGSDFTKENRDTAKNMNFGTGYGQSPFSFAEMYDIPLQTAKQFVDSWHKMFPSYWEWVRNVHSEVLQNGVLTSMFGRKRRFMLITNDNRDHVLKEGVNFKIQSVASDFHLHAAVILHDLLKDVGAHILIIVHDSIVLEVPLQAVDFVRETVRGVMESVPAIKLGWTDIPFKVDIGIGKDWGHIA